MKIEIPERFRKKLLPAVSSLIEDTSINAGSISNYLETTPYYFEEYTLHGARHIKAVLNYADRLIPQTDYDNLTELDISILILGIFLHDLGMFIKPCGLKYLLDLNLNNVRNEETGVCFTWKEMWDNYINKLKHAPGSELDEIFGDKEQIFDFSSREVCSVFIRKYHHEIALHIANYGFPGSVNHNTLEGIDSDCAKLVGILAKSHGVSLRSMNVDVNSFGYDNNLPLNVPIYYLMSILRLADLLDADGNRAPKVLSDMNEFSSSHSENEWTLNQLITGRQWAEQTGKPETLRIIASPTNSIQYLELTSWFDYWQKELDLSWAVIGETHNDQYKLSTRRITSNIFDNNSKYDFVTHPITLKVNPDIVKLLVAPLYGDNPSYGVRELLQNAIDACNERTAIDRTKGEIIVDINTENGIFTITDNGIGMSVDVITNYYLSAGASYRYSQQWSEMFTDAGKNPKIARSGRFGIGALATFLIGNKAKVLTRHINDDKGYHFEYTIEPNILNVDRVDKELPGTIIEIDMNKKAIEKFSYRYSDWAEWYHLTVPRVIYKLNGRELKVKLYNLKKDQDSNSWFSFKSNEYDSFHWSVKYYFHSFIMCNGIHIPEYHDDSFKNSLRDRGYYHKVPNLSVVDKNGTFPLDLARKNVLDSFVLNDEIVAELCKHRIAQILIKGVNENCIFNKRGFIPKEKSFMLNIDQPVYLIGKATEENKVTKFFNTHDVVIGFFNAVMKTYAKNIIGEIIGDDLYYSSSVQEIWVNRLAVKVFKTDSRDAPWENAIHNIDELGKWYESFPIPKEIAGENINLVLKYNPSLQKENENNIMYKVVQELLPNSINGGWIPIDKIEREDMYPDTYKKLKRYIDAINSQE